MVLNPRRLQFFQAGLFKAFTLFTPLLWLVVFFVIPLSFIWLLSFGEKVGIIEVKTTWTLSNYLRFFEPLYLKIFLKSVGTALIATAGCFLLGFPVALMIAFSAPRLRLFWLFLIMLPFWTNLLIRTYALIAVLRLRGYVNFTLEFLWEKANALLALLGLGHYQLLGEWFEPLELLYNNKAVVVGLVYVHLPFMVLPLYAALDRLDKTFLEASYDLGASHFRTFYSIILPLIKGGLFSGLLITFIPILGSFLTPELLGGSNSQLIANVIERQFKSANDFPFGAALSFLLIYLTFFGLAARALFAQKQTAKVEKGESNALPL